MTRDSRGTCRRAGCNPIRRRGGMRADEGLDHQALFYHDQRPGRGPNLATQLFNSSQKGRRNSARDEGSAVMLLILAILLLAILFGALGFAIHVLWWVALVVLVVWLAGFVLRTAEGAGSRRRRWYRW